MSCEIFEFNDKAHSIWNGLIDNFQNQHQNIRINILVRWRSNRTSMRNSKIACVYPNYNQDIIKPGLYDKEWCLKYKFTVSEQASWARSTSLWIIFIGRKGLSYPFFILVWHDSYPFMNTRAPSHGKMYGFSASTSSFSSITTSSSSSLPH